MIAPPRNMVVGVAAAPGGGKTTLSKLLAAKLGAAPVLHYDDYETLTQGGVPALAAWFDRGARFEDIPLPGFADDLAKLIAAAAGYVIIDAPLGRAHPATADKTDFLIYVDTPLDLALARVMRDHAARAAHLPDAAGQKFALWLEGYLDSYVRFTHRSLELQRLRIMPQADLVLDGALAPDQLAELALSALRQSGR